MSSVSFFDDYSNIGHFLNNRIFKDFLGGSDIKTRIVYERFDSHHRIFPLYCSSPIMIGNTTTYNIGTTTNHYHHGSASSSESGDKSAAVVSIVMGILALLAGIFLVATASAGLSRKTRQLSETKAAIKSLDSIDPERCAPTLARIFTKVREIDERNVQKTKAFITAGWGLIIGGACLVVVGSLLSLGVIALTGGLAIGLIVAGALILAASLGFALYQGVRHFNDDEDDKKAFNDILTYSLPYQIEGDMVQKQLSGILIEMSSLADKQRYERPFAYNPELNRHNAFLFQGDRFVEALLPVQIQFDRTRPYIVVPATSPTHDRR